MNHPQGKRRRTREEATPHSLRYCSEERWPRKVLPDHRNNTPARTLVEMVPSAEKSIVLRNARAPQKIGVVVGQQAARGDQTLMAGRFS